jgi:acetoin utilization deacetylase AcuC-like enzyme
MAAAALVFHPEYYMDDSVFPMPHMFDVYPNTRNGVLAHHAVAAEDQVAPEVVSRDELVLAHHPEYVDDLLAARRTRRTASSEVPFGPEVIHTLRRIAGGTVVAAREALRRGVAVNCGGGYHHAFADRAEGFCYINDLAVAARVVQKERLAARVAVVDLDVHQGNGTARIFGGDDTVFTFSMHQERLYPAKEKSDLDIGLDDGTGDDVYLELLAGALPKVFDAARPDLVLYQAGVDCYEHDLLGGLGVTKEGMRRRDRLVFAACVERGVPCAMTIGGGYAADHRDTVALHVESCLAGLRTGP